MGIVGIFLFVFLLWAGAAALCGVYAQSKGRSGAGFFFLSLFLSPILGFIIAAIVSPTEKKVKEEGFQAGENKKCPFCAEIIKSEAKVCKYCTKELPAGKT